MSSEEGLSYPTPLMWEVTSGSVSMKTGSAGSPAVRGPIKKRENSLRTGFAGLPGLWSGGER